MAGHRAATSVYATLGVAAATLLIVGGIVAGPSILKCSSDPEGLGACLREKVADTGLIAPDAERTERPDAVADIPPEPPIAAGWMEANATEYDAPVGASIDLVGSPADLEVVSPLADPVSPVEVAVAPAPELATSELGAGDQTFPVNLDEVAGSLVAEGAVSSSGIAPKPTALLGSGGKITTQVPVFGVPSGEAALVAQPSGLTVDIATAAPPEATIVTPAPIGSPGALTPVDPTPSEPAPVELQAETIVEPPPSTSPIVIEYNARYPNVLVLPPPASGDSSSFRSLQLN